MNFIKQFDNSKPVGVRDYWCTAIVGEKRQGKTTLAKLLIQHYIGLYPEKKVLIYDVSNAFTEYPQTTLDELQNGILKGGIRKKWQRGVLRLSMQNHEEVLGYMAKEFGNGLLIIDEATAVFGDNPSDNHKAVLITHTNRRTDIYAIFHSLAYVPKRLRGYFWHYHFFKTPDEGIGEKEIAAMGFPNPKKFYEQWATAQKMPHQEDKKMQKFTTFSREFQRT